MVYWFKVILASLVLSGCVVGFFYGLYVFGRWLV